MSIKFRRIYATNFPYDYRYSEVRRLMRKAGPIEQFHCYEGEAYIQYMREVDARWAYKNLHHAKYLDRRIIVEWALLSLNYPKKKSYLCYACGKENHIEKNCPRKKRLKLEQEKIEWKKYKKNGSVSETTKEGVKEESKEQVLNLLLGN